jgi:hypothetical protein
MYPHCSPTCNTLEPHQPLHDRTAGHVIAQEYSSATFGSRCFFRNETLGERFANIISLYVLKIA